MQLDLKILLRFPLFALLTLLGLAGAVLTDTAAFLIFLLAILVAFQANILIALIVFFGTYIAAQSLGNIASALVMGRR